MRSTNTRMHLHYPTFYESRLTSCGPHHTFTKPFSPHICCLRTRYVVASHPQGLPSSTIMAFRLLSLPPELLRKVIFLSQITDLKAIRLACKVLETHASEYLLKTVCLEFLPESIERLVAISEHPQFSKMVRTIEYYPRDFEHFESLEEFKEFWNPFGEQDGYGPAHEEMLSNFRIRSSNYAAQQELLTDSRLTVLFARAFANFPQLSSIAISDNIVYRNSQGETTTSSSSCELSRI